MGDFLFFSITPNTGDHFLPSEHVTQLTNTPPIYLLVAADEVEQSCCTHQSWLSVLLSMATKGWHG